MSSLDWKRFETLVSDDVLAAITKLMDRNASTFYAVVFHEFYAERGGVIAMPCLAANTIENLEGNEDSRWSSADWKWIDIKYLTPETKKLHRQIERAASDLDDPEWDKVYLRFVDVFVRVVKLVQPKLKHHIHSHRDFGVFVFAEETDVDEIEVLRRCTTPARFKKLFPHLQEEVEQLRPLDAGSPSSLGSERAPGLSELLLDKKRAWIAADVIGSLGITDPELIEGLKRNARTGREQAFHETRALARIGEVDFLLELAESKKTREVAIRGIDALYCSGKSSDRLDRVLDYRPLERLLNNPECHSRVEELKKRLLGFNHFFEIDQPSIEEALRGLESKHEIVRENAALILGNRKLGAKAAERILPALAGRLKDRHSRVRRMAILAMWRWRKIAKPYAGEIRKLFNDANEDVVSMAKGCVKELVRRSGVSYWP